MHTNCKMWPIIVGCDINSKWITIIVSWDIKQLKF